MKEFKKGQTVYVTSRVLISGEIEERSVLSSDDKFVYCEGQYGMTSRKSVFETRDEAIRKAKSIIEGAIDAANGILDRLSNITF